MTDTTTTRTPPTPTARASYDRTRRGLAVSLAVVLATDLVGGAWAATSGANTWGEAWSGDALLAAPVPMMAGQVLLTWIAVRSRRRRGAAASGLLAVACLLSVASGFFDGGLGNPALSPAQGVYQVWLLAATGVLGVLAALRTTQLLRA